MSTILPDRGKADDEDQYDLTEEQEAELEDRIAEIERGESSTGMKSVKNSFVIIGQSRRTEVR